MISGTSLIAASGFALAVPSGMLHAHLFGQPTGSLTLCVHGISGNSRIFDFLGERLAGAHRRLVAFDLRGRGNSTITPPGSYGWERHARDVLDAATALGEDRFDLVGYSMGAYVAMQAALLAPQRIRSLVLIDGLGLPDYAGYMAILSRFQRVDRVFPSVEAYLEAINGLGVAVPWNAYWERYFRYDLVAVAGGVRSCTSRDAILEDTNYGLTHDPRALWQGVTMPVLLIRAERGLTRHGGFIVTEADRRRFARQVRQAQIAEVEANHYGVMMHPDTAAVIGAFVPSGSAQHWRQHHAG